MIHDIVLRTFLFRWHSSNLTCPLRVSLLSQTTTTFLHQFSTPIFLKLAEENFLLWKQQVLATIDGLMLLTFLNDSQVLYNFLPTTDGSSPQTNPNFLLYQQRDNLIVAWMLASMTNPFLTKMVGLQSSSQIWQTLRTHFASNTCT